MKRYRWLLCLSLTPVVVIADGESEHAALARLNHEIEALEPMIREAELQADADARIHFQYDWLRADLKRVRTGIEEHLQAPRAEPRKVEPLQGDYRR